MTTEPLNIEKVKASYERGQADAKLGLDILFTDDALLEDDLDVAAYRRGARDERSLTARGF